jgi:hypothetical protein
MTPGEQNDLKHLREELHDYHLEVKEIAIRLDVERENIKMMHADIYGLPGNEESTGLVGICHDLSRSRDILRVGIRTVWGVLVVLIGTVAAWAIRKV